MDLGRIPTPCYVVDESRLQGNLEVIKGLQDRTGCKVILALKGFALFSAFPLMRPYLVGTTASSVHEARLGWEEFGGEVHAYAPAYSEQDIRELLLMVDHIVFNSFRQWHRFRPQVRAAPRPVSPGLRVNPEYSEIEVEIYDPCRRGSRLGIVAARFEGEDIEGIEGLHFHTLCGQNSDTLERTVDRVVERFGPLLGRLRWINFGGGHHINGAGYDLDRLCRVIERVKTCYGLQVYLEPGEAVALDAGFLVASVLDVIPQDPPVAVLDTSATAHMPDVLEMPYRPEVRGAAAAGRKAYTYRLGGLTCLAGDEMGVYSFDRPLRVGDRLIFEDMAHYTMVKNTTFNGLRLPSIALRRAGSGRVEVIRQFGYRDYRDRLS